MVSSITIGGVGGVELTRCEVFGKTNSKIKICQTTRESVDNLSRIKTNHYLSAF